MGKTHFFWLAGYFFCLFFLVQWGWAGTLDNPPHSVVKLAW